MRGSRWRQFGSDIRCVGRFKRVQFHFWGDVEMLSVDQFLRLISVPAVVAAFLIASQVSGAGVFHSQPAQFTSE